MLVLSRRIGKRLVIGGGITVEVCAIHKNSVRLGVTAPPHVTVNREEIQKRKDAEEARRISVDAGRGQV